MPYKLREIIQDTWPQLFILNKIQNNKKDMSFKVYSKSGCPYCSKIEAVLKLAELQHVVYKLDENFTKEEFYSKFGKGSTFPQVIVDGEQESKLGGCVETIQYLKSKQLV